MSPGRIIFAHPCKRGADFRYAREHGITYTTFDSSSELHKIAEMDPEFKCVTAAVCVCVRACRNIETTARRVCMCVYGPARLLVRVMHVSCIARCAFPLLGQSLHGPGRDRCGARLLPSP